MTRRRRVSEKRRAALQRRLAKISDRALISRARRAGFQRVEPQALPKIRNCIGGFVSRIAHTAHVIATRVLRSSSSSSSSPSTVSLQDVLCALRLQGIVLPGYQREYREMRRRRRRSQEQRHKDEDAAAPDAVERQDAATNTTAAGDDDDDQLLAPAPSPPPPPPPSLPSTIVMMRHGERADDKPDLPTLAPDWKCGDTSMTVAGFEQCRDKAASDFCTAARSAAAASATTGTPIPDEQQPLRVAVHVSPFLRCLQTARAMLEGFEKLGADKVVRVGPIVVDPQLCEVYGPSVIKDLPADSDGPELVAAPWQVLNVEESDCERRGSLPASFSESREMAYVRVKRRFSTILAAERPPGCDVLLVVTHGDAVNAAVTLLHPRRVIYECEYLGMAFVTREENDSNWTMSSGIGVNYFDD